MNTTITGSHIRAKDLGFWGNLNWNLFMIKVRYWNWSSDLKKKIYKKLFCKRKYHKLIPKDIQISKSLKHSKGMRCVLKLNWLECLNCNWLFFANAEDKKKYLNYKKKEQKNWGKMIESIMKEKNWKKK